MGTRDRIKVEIRANPGKAIAPVSSEFQLQQDRSQQILKTGLVTLMVHHISQENPVFALQPLDNLIA